MESWLRQSRSLFHWFDHLQPTLRGDALFGGGGGGGIHRCPLIFPRQTNKITFQNQLCCFSHCIVWDALLQTIVFSSACSRVLCELTDIFKYTILSAFAAVEIMWNVQIWLTGLHANHVSDLLFASLLACLVLIWFVKKIPFSAVFASKQHRTHIRQALKVCDLPNLEFPTFRQLSGKQINFCSS